MQPYLVDMDDGDFIVIGNGASELVVCLRQAAGGCWCSLNDRFTEALER